MSVSINAICRKDRINQNRTTNIYLRFTVNRRSRYVSTGINIPADDWDFDTQTLKTQNPAVQLRIYEQIEKYDKRIKRLEALEVPVTLDNVLETDGRRVYCTIAEYFRRTITQLESVGKIGSASKHKVTFSLLQQFRSTNIRFDEITVGYLRDFELFLMKKGNKSNSIATKFSVLKAVYNKALAEGIFTTPHSPFLQFKIGRLWTATRKRAIRKEEVQRLMQAEIPTDGSAYLDFARDIFLFSYLSAGINFKDIATLRYCDMDEERIYYARHKTSKEMTCHLSEQSKAIIGKYAKSDHADEDYIFPILDRRIHKTEQQIYDRVRKVLKHVNKALHEWSRLLGLKIELTTYVARHTFATVLKRSGVNIAII
ncbi:site-specific integrase, partial [Alistipes shahii]